MHYYLSLHPQIQMSATKEPHFFAEPAGGKVSEFAFGAPRVGRLDDYRELFDPRIAVRGEASPSYAAYPRRVGVPARIKELVPQARLIYLVRDPIERTVSHYRHRVATEGERRDFDSALEDLEPSNIYLCASRYATQLEQYLEHFPADRILVIEQGDLRRARTETLRKIFGFLEVASDFTSPAFATEYRGSDAGRRYPAWYRMAIDIGAKTPLSLLPVPVRRRLRARVEGAVLPALDDVRPGDGIRAKLTDALGEEAVRFRKLTGLDTATWSL